MPGRTFRGVHSIGLSSHKNQYRPSVLQGNWAEERGAADADPAAAPQPRFAGQSASHAAHGPQGKFGAGIACHRHDGARREPAGPSAVMAHADARQPCYTTLYQLSFGEQPGRRVQEMLWAGRKAIDFGVPRQTPHTALVEARHAAWRADAARSPWRDPVALAAPVCACACMGRCPRRGRRETTASAAARLVRAGARAATGGQPKGGPCTRHFDKTWLRIGLRG